MSHSEVSQAYGLWNEAKMLGVADVTIGSLRGEGPVRSLSVEQHDPRLGLLVQWSMLVTLVMFPILLVTCVRLAHREERDVEAELGDVWRPYASVTPHWIPRVGARRRHAGLEITGEEYARNLEERRD